MSDDKREERLGRAFFGVAWVTFAIVFIAIASAVALALLWLFGGPLWLAPVAGVAAYGVYRLIRLLFWKLVFLLIKK